ncbi:MAG: hypothetical protein QOJ64_4075 [Acidobacteriota bacterium]|jgi:hypothetical protein|nr:hypothetical protein [Acidobacteriota bacterium]
MQLTGGLASCLLWVIMPHTWLFFHVAKNEVMPSMTRSSVLVDIIE